jgi:hypothetical protein
MTYNPFTDLSCTVRQHAAKGIITSPGAGKTRSMRSVLNDIAKLGGNGTIVIFMPDLNLAREQQAELRADLPHLNIELYLGISQPDPTSPKHKMCRRHRAGDLVSRGIPIKSLCGDKQTGYCQHHVNASAATPCAYSQQTLKTPDIWICTHVMLFNKSPEFFGPTTLRVIDESFFRSAYSKPLSIEVDEIENKIRYRKNSYLLNLAHHVCNHIRNMQDGHLDVSVLSGYANNRLVNALDTVAKVSVNLQPNSTNQDIDNAIDQYRGSQSYALAMFWGSIAQLARMHIGHTPFLVKKTGSGKTIVKLYNFSYPHPTWESPTVLLDSTMPVEVNKKFFKNLEVERIDTQTSHTRYIQITDSLLSKTQFTRTSSAYDRVLEIVSVIAKQIPDAHPIKILLACSKAVEEELQQIGLPTKCETIHYGAVTGSNKYSDVPCIIVVGRIEIPIKEAELQAALLDERPFDMPANNYPQRQVIVKDQTLPAYYHPDPLTEEIRRYWNEGQILQAIGRGRAIRRTVRNPLDVILLTNVPLPIEEQHLTLTTWKDIQPTSLEVLLEQRDIVPLGTGELMRHFPNLFDTKDKARTAIKAVTVKYPELGQKIKVGGISSINIINRRNPTYFHKTTALIRYTPDKKGAKPVYALVRKRQGHSLQQILDELTPTKPTKSRKRSANNTNVPPTHYDIQGFIGKERHPLPYPLRKKQYYDEQQSKWVTRRNKDTTDECGNDNGRVYYVTKRSCLG